MNQRVVIFIPCLLIGGTEMHTLMLAKALMAGGYRVTICAYYEYDPAMVQGCRAIGVRVRLLGLSRHANGRLPRNARLAWGLMRVLREERPDAVHVQYMTPGVLPIVVARLCGLRVVGTIHVPAEHYGTRAWVPRTVGAILCHAFITVSVDVDRSFFGHGEIFSVEAFRKGRKHFAIPNCVVLEDVDRILATEPGLGLRRKLNLEDRPVIGMVGRVVRLKGHDVLLEAMAEVVRRVPSVILLIVGDGSERAALQEQAQRLQVADHIRWTGQLPQAEVFKHLTVMDVVAMPSRFEGFGLTAAEAMAFAKPVVATNIPGLREVVADGETGTLVPLEDARALASALIALLEDAAARDRLGSAGRRRVETMFSNQIFAQRFQGLYRVLLTP